MVNNKNGIRYSYVNNYKKRITWNNYSNNVLDGKCLFITEESIQNIIYINGIILYKKIKFIDEYTWKKYYNLIRSDPNTFQKEHVKYNLTLNDVGFSCMTMYVSDLNPVDWDIHDE